MTFDTYRLPIHERQRVWRFVVVGVSSTVVDFGLLAVLKTVGASTLIANTLAFSTGIAYNFTLSRRWTYHDTRGKPFGVQFGLFVILNLIGLVLNDALVLMLEAPLDTLLGHAAWGYLPAKLIATGAVAVWSFVTNRIWIFNDAG